MKALLTVVALLAVTSALELSHLQPSPCPQNQVVLANGTCGCPAQPHIHKNVSGFCVLCPPPVAAWHPQSHTCLTCPPGFNINPTNWRCECPLATPYLTTALQCVSCNPPLVWNQTTNTCQRCGANYHWSNLRQRCVFCPPGQVLLRSNRQCVCALGSYRDSQTGQCVLCLPPGSWDPQNNQCVCPPSLPYLINNNCEPCPSSQPVWDGSGCVACPPSHHYNDLCNCCCLCLRGLAYNQTAGGCVVG
jgi:hypothetical protein